MRHQRRRRRKTGHLPLQIKPYVAIETIMRNRLGRRVEEQCGVSYFPIRRELKFFSD